MKQPLWPPILIIVGLVVLAGSFLVNSVVPPSTRWSEEDGLKLQKAANDLHSASYELPQASDSGGPDSGKRPGYDPVAAKAKYDAAKQEYEKQSARLEQARTGGAWLPWAMRVLGALVVVIGAGGYALARSSRQD